MGAVVAAMLAFFGCSTLDNAKASPKVGSMAPGFTLPTPDGQNVDLDSMRGKPVLINFWATWCVPCREEMPLIEQAYKEAPGGLQVIGIDIGEMPIPVRDFANEVGVSFPLVLDRDLMVSSRYEVITLPATFFVDKGGTIRRVKLGPIVSKEDLDRGLQSIGAQAG